MKGYFSKIANRTVGNAPKAAFAPPKVPTWQNQEPLGDLPLKSDQADLSEWPDSFTGNPVNFPDNPSPSSLLASPKTEQPVQREQISVPLQPPSSDLGPPASLQPASQEVQEVNLVPPPSTPSPQKPVDPPKQEDSHPLGKESQQQIEPVKIPPPVTAKEKHGSESRQLDASQVIEPVQKQQPPRLQQPKGYARTPMVVNESDGLLGSALPQMPPKTTALEPPRAEPPSPPNEQVSTKREEPKVEQPIALQPIVPQAQQRPSPPELKSPQTHTLAPKAPIPSTALQQGTKGGLVIGKITVEVVDPPKPQVNVQAPPMNNTRSHTARQPHRRPDSNLKYGLGQI